MRAEPTTHRAESRETALQRCEIGAYLLPKLKVRIERDLANIVAWRITPEMTRAEVNACKARRKRQRRDLPAGQAVEHVYVVAKKAIDDILRVGLATNAMWTNHPGYMHYAKQVAETPARVSALVEVVRLMILGADPAMINYDALRPRMRCQGGTLRYNRLRMGLREIGRTEKEQKEPTTMPLLDDATRLQFRNLMFENPLGTKRAILDDKAFRRTINAQQRCTGPPALLVRTIGRLYRSLWTLVRENARKHRDKPFDENDGCPTKACGPQPFLTVLNLADALLALRYLGATAGRSGEAVEDACKCYVLAKVAGIEGYVPIELARAIDAACNQMQGAEGIKYVLCTTVEPKAKPSPLANKPVMVSILPRFVSRKLRGITSDLAAVAMAIKWPLRPTCSTRAFFSPSARADGLLVGRSTGAVDGMLSTHGADITLYAFRYRRAIELKVLLERSIGGGALRDVAKRVFGHVEDSTMVEDVYSDEAKTIPACPFVDHRVVPEARMEMYMRAIAETPGHAVSSAHAIPAGAMATSEAVDAALYDAHHLTMSELTKQGHESHEAKLERGGSGSADDGISASGRARAHASLCWRTTTVLKSMLAPSPSGAHARAQHDAITERTRPKSWRWLWELIKANPVEFDLDEVDLGPQPQSVIDSIRWGFQRPTDDTPEEDEPAQESDPDPDYNAGDQSDGASVDYGDDGDDGDDAAGPSNRGLA
jgi:hypothetical protein